jgi:ectoine hydroxylase-related dioxygenase (phytanoyl-CoA dioxygenase family)
MLFIDEVTEFNGPLMLIPGSHRSGMIDVDARTAAEDQPAWVANVSADLKYSLDRDTIAALVQAKGIVAPKGPAGTVLLFHPNLAHASVPNLSPFDRTVLIVTYNRVDNVPVPRGAPRPEFLVSRDQTPVTAGADDLQGRG